MSEKRGVGAPDDDPAGATSVLRASLPDAFDEAGRLLGARTVTFTNAAAHRLGLNRTDWECCEILDAEGPMSAGRLAELTGLSTGAITGIVDRLEDERLVRREPDPDDRRRVIVVPTPERRADELAEIYGPLVEGFEAVAAGHTDEELANFAELCREVADVFAAQTLRLRAGG